MLGTPAVRQIIAKLNKSDKEEQLLIEKIASSCQKFDHKGQGRLTADDLFNVVKLQNGIDCSKDEVKRIVSPLSKDNEGRIKGLFIDCVSRKHIKILSTNQLCADQKIS